VGDSQTNGDRKLKMCRKIRKIISIDFKKAEGLGGVCGHRVQAGKGRTKIAKNSRKRCVGEQVDKSGEKGGDKGGGLAVRGLRNRDGN